MIRFDFVPLPDGWRWERIQPHIAEFRSGIARGEKSRKSGYPHLRMNNISNELRLNFDELWRIPASEAELRDFALQDEDVLFNNTNSRDLVGKACLFEKPSEETFLYSNHITRIRTKPSLSSAYLVLWVNYLYLQGFFREKCDVWVNQAAIRVEDVLFPTKIPYPDNRDVQDGIAELLASRMAIAEKLRLGILRQLEAVRLLPAATLRDFFGFRNADNGNKQEKQ